MRLGDYRSAVATNLRAVGADSHHPGTHGRVGLYPTLRAHAREFLSAAAGMTGQFTIAREADDSLFVLLRFRQWDAVLSRAAPQAAISTLEWRVARVLALTLGVSLATSLLFGLVPALHASRVDLTDAVKQGAP